MRPAQPEDLSPVILEYLELIYALRAEGEEAYGVTLADHFGVSRANASATVQRMVRDGLVTLDGRRILLTEDGRVHAEAGLRRHRMTECFLLEVLGIAWERVHEQARSFERGLSPLLEARIDVRLGHPRTCPHGNPIPRADLDAATYLQARQARRLLHAPLQVPLQIVLLSEAAETSVASLGTLAAAGLFPGASITRQRAAEGGDVRVIGVGGPTTISSALAARLWVVLAVPAERGYEGHG